ncbi:MAG: murein biosynthesis integral membrane protein MurJ [Gammaproteobacteria bacterium]
MEERKGKGDGAPERRSSGGARGLLRSTSTVSSMTLLSRILGLVRDIVFARYFGAGVTMDAFFVANKIPNMLRRFFAEGAFSQAFVPVISEYRSTRSHEDVQALVDRVAGTLGALLFAITAIGVVASPVLVIVFAPGFLGDDGRFDLTAAMLRLTFPYLLFISLTALAGGILNTYGRFGVPAFTPVLLNVVLIAFAVLVAPRVSQPGLALAAGVFVAGVVQLLFQLPFLARIRALPRPTWGRTDDGVRRVGRLMLPALFGSSVAQINILIDNQIASFLGAGKISWLYYSDRLMEFPLGVFGIALATVILPGLSVHHARREQEAFARTVDWALRLVLLIGIPAALGLAVLAGPLIVTIFFGGEFTAFDVRMARLSLVAFSFGLLGFILVKVLAPAYFSRQDTRTPVRIAVVALLCNLFLNLVFVLTLVRLGADGTHAGLALATSLAAFVNAGLLYRGLRRDGILRHASGWGVLLARIGLASSAMVAVLLWLDRSLDWWLTVDLTARVGWLALCVGAGMGVYAAVLLAAGLRPRQFRLGVVE